MRTTVSKSVDIENTQNHVEHSADESTALEDFDASKLPFEIPVELLTDVKRIKDQNTCYFHLQAQRDRRLRILIRRFTNQIQYGCRNINCDTPTCLSYRKRNSRVPLRKYTDLSARTLACRLVEDYGEHGGDSGAGLCPNDPVVPWYDDPVTAAAKWNKLGDRTNVKSKDNSLRKSSQDVTSRHSHQHNHRPSSDHSQTPSSGQSNGLVKDCNQPNLKHSPKRRSVNIPGPNTTVPVTNDTKSKPSNSIITEDSTDINVEKENAINTSATKVDMPGRKKKKDFASFTQTLFDLVPLRSLSDLVRTRPLVVSDQLPQESRGYYEPEQEGEEEEKDDKNEKQDTAPSLQSSDLPTPLAGDPPDATSDSDVSHECGRFHSGTNFCGLTLQQLSWQSLVWISRKSSKFTSKCNTPFEKFVRQSIAYSLADAERLAGAVSQWHHDLDPDLTNEHHNVTLDFKLATTESNVATESRIVKPAKSNHNHIKALDHNTILFGFLAIRQATPVREIMRFLDQAVHQCFFLPKVILNNLRRSRDLEIQPSRLSSTMPRVRRYSQIPPKSDDELVHLTDHKYSSELLQYNLRPLTQYQVSVVLSVALMAAASCVFTPNGDVDLIKDRNVWTNITELRKYDVDYSQLLYSDGVDNLVNLRGIEPTLICDMLEECQSWHTQQLIRSIMLCIAHSSAVAQTHRSLPNNRGSKTETRDIVRMIVYKLASQKETVSSRQSLAWAMLELVRTVLLFNWDGKAIVQRTSVVGGALQFLAGLYKQRQQFSLEPLDFWMPFIGAALDEMEIPVEWMAFRPDGKCMHLLSFSFLFGPATLVRYFRTINIDLMRKSHEEASIINADARQFLSGIPIPIHGGKEVLADMRPYMHKYFVLTVRRDNLLDDATDQLWHRQRREIMRPLRVRLGKDEGEDGLDHGGVQQEFFRLLFTQAFNPEYGMFTVDDKTRMTWFQPGTLEPLYRYEALGTLMSLAVYNAVTLPITMPLAFYRKLLGMKVKKLDHISDGWPDLARGLQTLLDWSDGDVGDVIARTYEFSYDFAGKSTNIDMSKGWHDISWSRKKSNIQPTRKGKEKMKSTSFEIPTPHEMTPPTRSSTPISQHLLTRASTAATDLPGIETPISIESEAVTEAPLVTNANRQQYVTDYISWLTDKSIVAEYQAFANGFFTCLDRTALSIFTPESLKSVIEGHTEINIDQLEQTTTYDDYTRHTPLIEDFWQIVRNFSPEQHRKLLEFVTASDRVPVNGLSSVTFIIQRNGEDDMRLPSSSTCYGRLLLPMYSSKEVLKEKLEKAIENSMGFGVL